MPRIRTCASAVRKYWNLKKIYRNGKERGRGSAPPFFFRRGNPFVMQIVIVLLSAAGIVAVDQILKAVMLAWLAPIGHYEVIPGFFSLVYVENRGAAFGILQNQQWLFALLTVAVCAAIAVALFRYRHHDGFSWAACALILGGGIGNVIDRLVRQFVVDYLSFSIFPPVFNFADICVVAGAVCFLVHVLRRDRKEAAKPGAEA